MDIEERVAGNNPSPSVKCICVTYIYINYVLPNHCCPTVTWPENMKTTHNPKVEGLDGGPVKVTTLGKLHQTSWKAMNPQMKI